ncbi:AraC family transcriptional regulator [Scytonema tolypothrichoides VB-61278]|nr:AraC family transcriptional regulator [Scytonema tolypothrichoides VB-61278]
MKALVTAPAKTVHLPDNGVNPPIFSSQSQGWENILVEEFHHPPGQLKYQSEAEHAICLCLAPRPFRLSQVKGDRRYTSLYTKGDMSITPAGIPFFAQWDGNDRYLWIRIPSHFTHKVAKEAVEIDPHQIELLPEFRVRNPSIEQIGMMLLTELKNGGLAGRLYIESLTNVLAVQLLRNYSATQPSVSLYNGGLSERQLLVVTDYIHEYLSEEIKLSQLAELLGMSQFHFSRLFKQSVGIPPHQYLLQQRVERAKQLLKQTELSITEVAFLCGFNSHSHLSKWFRQLTGITPKTYRVEYSN